MASYLSRRIRLHTSTRSPFSRPRGYEVSKRSFATRRFRINVRARGLRGGQTIKNETIYIQRTAAASKKAARACTRGLRLGKRAFIVRHLFELRAQCLLARVVRLRDRDTPGEGWKPGSLFRDKMEMEFLLIVFTGARPFRFNLANDKSALRADATRSLSLVDRCPPNEIIISCLRQTLRRSYFGTEKLGTSTMYIMRTMLNSNECVIYNSCIVQ